MNYKVFLFGITFCFLFFFSVESNASAHSIVVHGNKRIDEQTILFYVNANLTQNWNSKALADLMKRLYSTNLFSDVKVDISNNGTITITVKENPVLISLNFKGNSLLPDKALYEAFPDFKEMRVFSRAKMKSGLATLKEMYNKSGKWGVRIDYEVKKLAEDRISCVIYIEEGPTAKIRGIKFIGNKFFDESVLTAVLYSKKAKAYDFFSVDTNYSSENLIADRVMLKRFYVSRGYLDFDVISEVSEISDDYKNVFLTLSIKEGEKYFFGKSIFEFDKTVSSVSIKEQVQNSLRMTKGSVFNFLFLASSVNNITKYLNVSGFPFSFVDYDYERNGRYVDVTYKVATGKKVYVNSVIIDGNAQTMEYVIRKKLVIRGGDPYSATLIEQTKAKIYSLGFFDKVEVRTRRLSDSLVDVIFSVKERNTGVFQFGGGYSSVGGAMANINVSQKNFLGTGEELSFVLEKSQRRFSSSITLGQHDIFDTDISFAGSFFFYSNDAKDLSFTKKGRGLTLGFGRNFTDNFSLSTSYSYKKSNVSAASKDSSISIKEQEGLIVDSSIGYVASYGKVDNAIHPVSGYSLSFSQDVSGLGGNVHYLRTIGAFNYYKPVFGRISNSIFFKFKHRMGYIFDYEGNDLLIGQRFFLGSEEIRGFDNYGIGPRTTKGEVLGGKFIFNSTFQLDFPIGLPKDIGLTGSVFVDFGTLFGLDEKNVNFLTSDNMRVSTGFGFAWRSPMGPMRVDFGFPIKKEPYDVKSVVRFSMDY